MAPDIIEADCECSVTFGAAPPCGSSWFELSANEADSPIYLRRDGKVAFVTKAGGTPDLLGVQIRSLAPFAAALQSRLTLHASCVRRGDLAYAFIGESGAGKSTFARQLVKLGLDHVCDDLLAVRLIKSRWCVPVLSSDLTLAGLYFLRRRREGDTLNLEPLVPHDAMLAHLNNGFGELRVPAIWQIQFDAYRSLSSSVSNYQLDIPDGLDHLPRSAAAWIETVAESAYR